MNRVIKQKHYPTLTVDTDENDIIQITQNGKEDFNLIMIEKENVDRFVKLLCPELSQPELKAVKTALTILEEKFPNAQSQDWFKPIFMAMHEYGNQFSQPKEGEVESLREDIIDIGRALDRKVDGKTHSLSRVQIVAQINTLKNNSEKSGNQLNEGRDYLMSVNPSELTVENALIAFGFGHNGLNY